MEASVVGVFRVLFIIIIVYYIFRLLVRFVFPFILKNYLKKAQRKFYDANPHLDPEPDKQNEGEIKVKSKSQQDTKSKDQDFGEYVDYEEIKD
jgi:hypothetical protein